MTNLLKLYFYSHICFIKFLKNNIETHRLSIIGRTGAFGVKKALDSRFPILVTRCEKRSKKFLRFRDFSKEVSSQMIEQATDGH